MYLNNIQFINFEWISYYVHDGGPDSLLIHSRPSSLLLIIVLTEVSPSRPIYLSRVYERPMNTRSGRAAGTSDVIAKVKRQAKRRERETKLLENRFLIDTT